MSVKNLIRSAFIVSLLVSATSSFAQQNMPPQQQRTPEAMTQRQMTWMQSNLSLTSDQVTKVHDIVLKYAQQSIDARNAPQGTDRREAMMTIMKNREAELKGVLTNDQFQKLQQHQQEMRQSRPQGGNMQQSGN